MPPLPNSRASIVELRGYVEDGCELDKYVNSTFDELDANSDGVLSKEELRPVILHMTELLGLPNPENTEAEDILVDDVFRALFSANIGAEIDRETFAAASREILCQIVEGSGNALLKSVSDGAAVREMLAEKEDILGMADEIFDELDSEKCGKLDSSHIQTALEALGLDDRIPSQEGSSSDAAIDSLISKYGQGRQFLRRDDFLRLLEDILA